MEGGKGQSAVLTDKLLVHVKLTLMTVSCAGTDFFRLQCPNY